MLKTKLAVEKLLNFKLLIIAPKDLTRLPSYKFTFNQKKLKVSKILA